MGLWDRKKRFSVGRLANYLEGYAAHFSALALKGVEPRNYRIIHEHEPIIELNSSSVPILDSSKEPRTVPSSASCQ